MAEPRPGELRVDVRADSAPRGDRRPRTRQPAEPVELLQARPPAELAFELSEATHSIECQKAARGAWNCGHSCCAIVIRYVEPGVIALDVHRGQLPEAVVVAVSFRRLRKQSAVTGRSAEGFRRVLGGLQPPFRLPAFFLLAFFLPAFFAAFLRFLAAIRISFRLTLQTAIKIAAYTA